jgi:hypothetical protein
MVCEQGGERGVVYVAGRGRGFSYAAFFGVYNVSFSNSTKIWFLDFQRRSIYARLVALHTICLSSDHVADLFYYKAADTVFGVVM